MGSSQQSYLLCFKNFLAFNGLFVTFQMNSEFHLKSIEEISENYKDWKLVVPENVNELCGSKSRKWKAGYNKNWIADWPWIDVVKVNGEVKGILCKVCRDRASKLTKADAALVKSREILVNVPLVKFGAFVESARKHEFGHSDTTDAAIKKYGVKKFQQQV